MNEAYRLSSTLWYISDLHVIPSWVKHVLVYTIDEKMPQYVAPLCQLSNYHVCVWKHLRSAELDAILAVDLSQSAFQ